jgi:hypothetical protein
MSRSSRDEILIIDDEEGGKGGSYRQEEGQKPGALVLKQPEELDKRVTEHGPFQERDVRRSGIISINMKWHVHTREVRFMSRALRSGDTSPVAGSAY